MLRRVAVLARDMLDRADDLGLSVSRLMLESIERRASAELGADTMEKARADLRALPPEIMASLQTRAKVRVQLRQMSDIIRSHSVQNGQALVESAWRSLAEQIVAMIDAAPPPGD